MWEGRRRLPLNGPPAMGKLPPEVQAVSAIDGPSLLWSASIAARATHLDRAMTELVSATAAAPLREATLCKSFSASASRIRDSRTEMSFLTSHPTDPSPASWKSALSRTSLMAACARSAARTASRYATDASCIGPMLVNALNAGSSPVSSGVPVFIALQSFATVRSLSVKVASVVFHAGMIEYSPNCGRRPRSVECNGGTRPDVAGCVCLILPLWSSERVMSNRVLGQGGRSDVDAFSKRAEGIRLNCDDLTMGTVAVKDSVSSSVGTAPPGRTVLKARQIYPAPVTCVTPPIR